MILILAWLVFGLIVGTISKFLHPGDEPVGCLTTIGIGVVGSFIGGAISWLLLMGTYNYHPSGFLMSIIGGVIFCSFWRWYSLRNSSSGPKSFFTGKHLR